MSSNAADPRIDSSADRQSAGSTSDGVPETSEGQEIGPRDQARDLRWLAIGVVSALLVHFGWTVPWGPFEASPRNRIRSHEAFAALKQRYEEQSFEREPENQNLAQPMAFVARRAVQLARTQLIAAGHQTWLELSDLACRSTRCRFSVCAAPNFPERAPLKAVDPELKAPLLRALQSFELSQRPAWELESLDGVGCPRYEVRFLQLPRSSCLMTLR